MPISSAIKGLQSIKSMKNAAKSGIPNKEDSEFINLYLFEKERSRLQSEEIRILQRLEIIQNRLKEIQVFTNEKAKQICIPETKKSNKKNQEEVKSDFKTMSIDY
ncbi:MAG: hypothetical protein HQ510_05575 [Candidatus Marinimicrobia bacterium]|nr:hypothetical protein [Candidatus Neomarinimicrobiota bacterium]